MHASSASSASRMASRTFCNWRCRRCFHCCATSSTSRGRCSDSSPARSTVASGIVQFAAGFVVDRLGARPVLLGGMALLVVGTLAGVAGARIRGGSFRVRRSWVRATACSIRPISRSSTRTSRCAGWAMPIRRTVSAEISAMRSRRSSASDSAPRSAGAWRWPRWVLRSARAGRSREPAQRAHVAPRRDAHLHTLKGSIGLFVKPAILLCFAYFVFQTAAAVGLADVPALGAQRRPRGAAGRRDVGRHGYLLGGTAGIVIGGFLAVRTSRHDRVAATGLLLGAALLALIAANAVPMPWIVPVFVVIGLFIGATGPSRDLIVRNATPRAPRDASTASSTPASTSVRCSAPSGSA